MKFHNSKQLVIGSSTIIPILNIFFLQIDIDDPRVPTGICDTCRIKSKHYTIIPSTDLSMENFEDIDPNLESDCYCLLCKTFREPKSWLRGKKRKTALQKVKTKKDLQEVKNSGDENSNQNIDETHDPLSIETTTEEVSFVDFTKFFNEYYYL